MDFQLSYSSVVNYIGSFEGALDLDESQVEKLARLLARTQRVNVELSPEAVHPHAVAAFPELTDDEGDALAPRSTRVVPPRGTQQKRQIPSEAQQILSYFFTNEYWARVAPFAPPAILKDGTIGSRVNHAAFFNCINNETVLGRGKLPVRHDVLCNIVVGLDQSGQLEHYAAPPVVVEKIVEAPKPTEKELNDKRVRMERAMNDRDSSPIKGSQELMKRLITPVLSEKAKAQRNAKNAEDNATIAEAVSRINAFTGHSHARTQSGRAAAHETLQNALDNGASAKDALAAVLAKIDSLAGNSSIR